MELAEKKDNQCGLAIWAITAMGGTHLQMLTL